MTDATDRAGYCEALQSAIGIGGLAVIATFAIDGPEVCSGLPVTRYTAELLAAEFEGFDLVRQETEKHVKPDGETQKFQDTSCSDGGSSFWLQQALEPPK